MRTAGTALRCPIKPGATPIDVKLERYSLPAPSGCRIWVGARDKNGYGLVVQPGYASCRGAHRAAYEVVHGEIPAGLVVDHLCREKRCINVAHMQVVTQRANVRRGGNPGERITRVKSGRQSRKSFSVVHRVKMHGPVPRSEVPHVLPFPVPVVLVGQTPEGAVPAHPAPSAPNSTVCPECRHIGGAHDDGVLSGSGRACSRFVGAGAS